MKRGHNSLFVEKRKTKHFVNPRIEEIFSLMNDVSILTKADLMKNAAWFEDDLNNLYHIRVLNLYNLCHGLPSGCTYPNCTGTVQNLESISRTTSCNL